MAATGHEVAQDLPQKLASNTSAIAALVELVLRRPDDFAISPELARELRLKAERLTVRQHFLPKPPRAAVEIPEDPDNEQLLGCLGELGRSLPALVADVVATTAPSMATPSGRGELNLLIGVTDHVVSLARRLTRAAIESGHGAPLGDAVELTGALAQAQEDVDAAHQLASWSDDRDGLAAAAIDGCSSLSLTALQQELFGLVAIGVLASNELEQRDPGAMALQGAAERLRLSAAQVSAAMSSLAVHATKYPGDHSTVTALSRAAYLHVTQPSVDPAAPSAIRRIA